ncbi:MAG: LPS export ABC transporter permease LptG [Pseudomonadota bacterium]
MTLHFYFARRFFTTFLGILAIILGIVFMVEMVESIRRFEEADLDIGEIAILTALNAPEGLYSILPLIVIIATIVLFLSLARSSEIVITRAAGRSAFRSLTAPVFVALCLGILALSALNPIVAATSRQYDNLRNQLLQGVEADLSLSGEGLWLRQGSPEGQTVIRARRANVDGTTLFRVTFFGLTAEGDADYRIEARRAELVEGFWRLSDAQRWNIRDDLNPQAGLETVETMDIPTDLTRNRIRDSFGTPSAIPIWELPQFIERLELAGFSARNHRMWFQSQLALPLTYVAMVLLGASFTMRHTRMGRTGVMVLISIGMGFGLYFIGNFARILAENGQLPVSIAAWGPPSAAILLCMGLLLHLEDG